MAAAQASLEPLEALRAELRGMCNYQERQALRNASPYEIAMLLERKREEQLRGLGIAGNLVLWTVLWAFIPGVAALPRFLYRSGFFVFLFGGLYFLLATIAGYRQFSFLIEKAKFAARGTTLPSR